MFVLKIIVISSAILNIGFSATQCNPNNVIKFTCLDPECKVENGFLVGRTYTNPNSEVNILGYNTDSYFVEQNEKFSIRPQQTIRLLDYSTLSSWKYHVSIHNETYKICKPINVNQSNEESYNDNNAQISKNTEVNKFQTSDEVRSKDPSTNNFDINNETERLNNTQDEDIDEIVLIESEDELNLDISSKQDPSTVGSIITRSPLTSILSANSDQNSNFEPVEKQNDFSEKIDQNIITNPTSPNKLENDSSTECSLSSCGKNKFEENVPTTDRSSKNISPVNEENLHNKKTDTILKKPILNTPQKQHVESTVDALIVTDNTLPSQDSSKIPEVQDNNNGTEELTSNTTKDSANKMEPEVSNSSIDNNNFQELKSESNHQLKADPSPNTPQHQTVEITVDVLNDTDNTLHSQDSSKIPEVQDNNKGTEELTFNTKKDSAIKMEPQVSSSSIDNNNFLEIKSESDHKVKTDPSPNTPQHQNVESTFDILKDINNILPSQDSSKIPGVQDNKGSTEELTSNTKKDSAIKMEPQVSSSSIDNNNFLEIKSESDQVKTDPSPNTPQHQNVESTVDILKDINNNLPSQDSSKIPGVQESNNFKKIKNEKLQNSSSLETITQANHQSAIDNSIHVSSSTKEEVERINESDKVNHFSKDLDGDNLQDYYNTSEVNETQKQPEIYKTITESEYQNISEDSNSKSTTSTNDQINDETPSSPTQDLMNTSDIVPSTDNKKPIHQCASEGECSPLLDSTQKYNIEKSKPENKISHETVYKAVEPNNIEQLKEYEPKSFVASFGHPDTCIGVNCLKFNRNVEKVIKFLPINPTEKQTDPDETSHSANTDFDIENKNINNEITEQSHVEMSFFDLFQNWISSPTSNSINFLWNIFGEHSNEYDDVYHDQTVENQKMFQNVNHSELYFIVVAVITLLFSLVYYKHQKGTYENHLLTLLATKDQSLLIIEKELSLLKELSTGSMISTTERNSEVETLNEHLTKSEDIILSQSLRIEKLEQEVEELTESGMEMHTLLSSALESSSKNTEKLNSLKSKLIDSENLISTLTQTNFDKTTELEKKNDTIKSIQTTVDELTIKNMNLVEDNARISLQQEQIIAKNMQKESKLLAEIKNLQYELDRQTSSVVTAENEVLLSKDALQEIASQKFNPVDAKKFLSSVKLSAELKSSKQMCEGYKHKLNESLKLNQQYLDHIDVLKSDIANLENKLEKLERKNEESINKLNILTHFFKDQEKDYLKQINEKAVLCDNKEGESSSLNERLKSQNQEIANYKSEIQSLKKEITDQEASFKIQISAAEKKASDCWISFRQAERKLKEMELETAQLRNKLTMVDKKLENGAKSIDSSKDFEDELLDIPLPTVSPDFTLLSLLDFEPPPPILTNQRLPPLGALGQAPSPTIPLSRRHNRSLSPGSPPPLQRSSVFRPLPQRYTYMDRQNSLGHSVESLDK